MTVNQLTTLLLPLRNLRSLALDNSERLGDDVCNGVLIKLTQLEYFQAQSYPNSQWLDPVIPHWPQLKTLHLRSGSEPQRPDNATLRLVAEHCPSFDPIASFTTLDHPLTPPNRDFLLLQTLYNPITIFIQTIFNQNSHMLSYFPRSALGTFCRAVFRGESHLPSLFDALSQSDKDCLCLWPLARSFRGNYDSRRRALFYSETTLTEAVAGHIVSKLDKLEFTQRNEVYGKVCLLADHPHTDDPQWGEHHAKDNLARLADALENPQI